MMTRQDETPIAVATNVEAKQADGQAAVVSLADARQAVTNRQYAGAGLSKRDKALHDAAMEAALAANAAQPRIAESYLGLLHLMSRFAFIDAGIAEINADVVSPEVQARRLKGQSKNTLARTLRLPPLYDGEPAIWEPIVTDDPISTFNALERAIWELDRQIEMALSSHR
jgi:hypothetical protein